MSDTCVTLVCQEGVLLNALLEQWEESELASHPLELVSSVVDAGSVMYQGRPKTIDSLEDYDFSRSKLVVFLESSVVAESCREELAALACPVLGGYSDLLPLEPEYFMGERSSAAKVLGYGQPVITALSGLLSGYQVESIDLNVMVPASVLGQAAVEELASQTARLLNAQSVESRVFGRQLPFNYFPMGDVAYGQAWEEGLVKELSAASLAEEFSVNSLQAPVFYGISAFASVVFGQEVSCEAFIEHLQTVSGVEVAQGLQNLSNQQANALDGDLLVGNFRQNAFNSDRIDFWFAMDDLKFLARKCVISHALFLLKSHL